MKKRELNLVTVAMDNVNVLRTGFFALDFSLPDTLGDIYHLNDNLKDAFTCLCFFPDGDNEKINSYLKDLNQGLPNTASGLPVKLVGICPKRVPHLKNFKDKLKLNFPVLSDFKLLVSSRYYVTNRYSAKPAVYFSLFVIDDSGTIQLRFSEVPGQSKYSGDEFRAGISRLI